MDQRETAVVVPVQSPDLVTIGRITAPQGVQGEVRVYSLSDFPERWSHLRQVLLGDPPRPVNVRFRGWRGTVLVLAIEGVTDRNTAEALRDQELKVPADALHPLPADTFYVFQLQGLEVVDPAGVRLGRVVNVEDNPANHLLVVELPDGREVRVPMVRSLVTAIDVAGGRVVVDPIPGLLE